MDAIVQSGRDHVELTLGRAISGIRIEWPNGVCTGAKSGDALKELAAEALVPVRYSCDNGGCGICEHRLVDGINKARYTRICVARVPKTSPTIAIVPSDRV